MSDEPEGQIGLHTKQGVFATTHWSVVLAVGSGSSPQKQEALDKLCQTYPALMGDTFLTPLGQFS